MDCSRLGPVLGTGEGGGDSEGDGNGTGEGEGIVRGEGREQVRGEGIVRREGRGQVKREGIVRGMGMGQVRGWEGTDVSTIHTPGCYGDHILIVSSGSGVVSVTLSSVAMETTPAR